MHRIFYLLLLSPTLLAAQRTYLGVVAGSSSTTYVFDDPAPYPGASDYFLWKGEQSGTDYLLGADLTRSWSTHWEIRLGMRFATSGYEQSIGPDWVETGDGDIVPLPEDRLSVSHLFLEVPLAARYLFLTKKWTPYAEAGISANTYLSTRVSERIGDEPNRFWKRNGAVRPLNLRAQVAAGIQFYSAQGKICWFGQMTGHYQMIRIEKMVRNPLIDLAVETGCRFRLKG